MTVLRPFSSVEGEGGEPTGNVIADSQGNLYGTTSDGGHCASGQPCGGTVFKLRSSGASIWRKKVLGAYYNPMYSYSGLTFDGAGNLYGVAPNYGTSGWVFKLSKPAPGTAPWTTTYVFGFDGTNGSNPYGSLIVDAAGNLYGTALTGGAYGLGTVFMLTP
jgi:uncharacterized repeat protein (TIGR03803 family)